MLQKGYEQEPSYIVESKKRCAELGMDPNIPRIPKNVMSELMLDEKRQAYKEILEVVKFFSMKMIKSLEGTPILIAISDENGYLLDTIGDETIKSTMAQLGIRPGIQFSEDDMGTNVVSLTLKQNHPVQLVGTNHYHTFLHNSACYGVPFHYADVNNLLGSICIMTGVVLHNPFFLMTLTTVVDAIERELLLRKQNRKLNMMNQIMLSKTSDAVKSLNEAREFNKRIAEFFSNISHELKTPLNVIFASIQILGLTENAELPASFKKKLNKYLKSMKQNCYRLLRLVNNLIDLSKFDSGYVEPNMGNHNIISIIEDITLSVADYVEDRGVGLIFDTDTEEKIMAVDDDKLERIILNLLSNSIKFTPKGGQITVSINDCGENVLISVKDTGIGIPVDKTQMIFERFGQVDKTLSRNREGSGIGLSLVKSLVSMHSGTISVKSKYGEGSEFIINLPVKLVEEKDVRESSLYQNKVERISIEFSDIYDI